MTDDELNDLIDRAHADAERAIIGQADMADVQIYGADFINLAVNVGMRIIVSSFVKTMAAQSDDVKAATMASITTHLITAIAVTSENYARQTTEAAE